MFKDVLIAQHERGLRFRQGHFIALLPPGRHTVFTPSWDRNHECIEIVDTRQVRFEHPMLPELLNDTELRAELAVAEVADGQRGLVFRNGDLFAILPPGLHAFWKSSGEIDIEIFSDSYPRVAHRKIEQIVNHADADAWFEDAGISGGGLAAVSSR